MKKGILIILTLFLTWNFFSNEISQKDNTSDFSIIEKELGLGFVKNSKYLKRYNDFIEALSPVPSAKSMYMKSYNFITGGGILLGSTVTMYISAAILTGFAYIYLDTTTPSLYNPITSLYFSCSALGLLVCSIPCLILSIVNFVKSSKMKKEAIILYNIEAKKKNNNSSLFREEMLFSPTLAFDNNRNLKLGLNFTYLF